MWSCWRRTRKHEHDRKAPSRRIEAPADAPTAVAPSPTAAAAPIEYPSGGFQWSAELRAELPIVRGIHAPPRVDGHALLEKLLVLADNPSAVAERRFDELAQLMGRPWLAWRKADSTEAITRERLMRPDREYWLELHAQALVARTEEDPFTMFGYGRAVPWVMNVCAALHGLPLVVGIVLDLSRAYERRPGHFDDMRAGLLEALRAIIAAADDAAHDAAIAVLEAESGNTRFDRLTRALVCPHRADWALEALREQSSDEAGATNASATSLDPLWLGECVLPAAECLTYMKQREGHTRIARGQYVLHRPLLLQLALHDEGAIDLLAFALANSSHHGLEKWLPLAQRMHSPRMLAVFAALVERNEVRPTLDAVAKRWPAAMLKAAIEHAMTSPSRLAEAWAVGMALREPAALAAAMPALDEAARTRFAALLAELHRRTAPDDKLPPLLREPPWRGKTRQAELPTLALTPSPRPDTLHWPPGVAHELPPKAVRRPDDEKRQENLRAQLKIAPAAWARVLAGEPLQLGDVPPASDYAFAWIGDLFALPEAAALSLWNHCPPQHWACYGDPKPELTAMLAKWGPAAIPGFAGYAKAHVADVLELAQIVDSPLIAPAALHALRRTRAARPHAIAWLRAYPDTACSAAIPLAFGKDKAARNDAAFALRWLVREGFESTVKDAAASYGAKAVPAVQALLDADPLLILPARMPTLPSFFVAASLHRPELRAGGGALPIAAMEHIGTMLAISKLDAPYAGLDVVREACTPASLASFAWDVFEAWMAADSPSHTSWAFTALGLLGDDETARRLTPRIREWARKQHRPRALAGVDVLAAIGSDVALMHLDGIASKEKVKPLQERAKEKIAAVAEARELTAAELADRLVPDLGLDSRGTLQLDFGPRQFSVGFDESLEPFVRDAQGARLKAFPRPQQSDDAERAAAATVRWKAMKEDAKAVASLQVVRLELAMVDRRRWRAKDFRLYHVEHPLMRHLAARLLWGVYGADGVLQRALRVAEDWTLADAADNAATLADDEIVGIAHVLEAPKPLLDAFVRVFADYEILQPFKQLGRETYVLTDAERKSSRLERFADNRVVSTGSVMGLMYRGWERGLRQEAWIGSFAKPVGNGLRVELELDPGTDIREPMNEPGQRLPGITLRQAGTRGQDGLVNFERLHPIIASEVLRDVELLVPYRER